MTLSCSSLSVHYGPQPALSKLSFTLQPGEICALIGPNGSGKSTALHALSGLTKPTQGEVLLDGKPIQAMSRKEIAKRLAFLPQNPIAPEEMTVEQLVRQGRFAHVGLLRRYDQADEDAISWAMECTGIADFGARSVGELSGGERQRVWISAALAQDARILLLDEPTSFLDIGHQIEVLDLIHDLSRTRGVAIIVAIHDINQAIAISDRICLLEHGSLLFDGKPESLALSGLVEKAFRVSGQFIQTAEHIPPYFEVQLERWRMSAT
ncbi:ABC transporter ATP-binding protein [Ochrobactrum sp. S46]|nr:ABC transporter ATP-binding protein [Ochrobactrum sp. S45]MBK0046394.1 ABC transporter ATP-binding protein [Ochrobactrum sp. S46]